MTESNGQGTDLLLSYEAGNHLHHYGGRVYKDGRYELRDDDEPAVDGVRPVHAGADRRDRAGDRRARRPRPHHRRSARPTPRRATFVLKGRTVEVDEWPKAAPQLAALLDTIAELRKSRRCRAPGGCGARARS